MKAANPECREKGAANRVCPALPCAISPAFTYVYLRLPAFVLNVQIYVIIFTPLWM